MPACPLIPSKPVLGTQEQEPLGADAFLPALTEELIWSPNIGETQLDVEFLMELLDPDQLRGEGERPPNPENTRIQLTHNTPAAGGPWLTCLIFLSWLLPDHMVWGTAPHCPL